MSFSRFRDVDENTVMDLKTTSKCKNTIRSTNVWVRAYDEWRKARNVIEKLEETDPVVLNTRLEQFYAQLRQKNGKEYQPNCLNVMIAALDRELKNNGCTFSLNDREFHSSREVLNGKAKKLRYEGYGKKNNASKSISPAEEDLLWNSGYLGVSSPRVLLNTVWWILNQQYGGRGQEGHYELNIEEFSLATDEMGREYIKYTEGPRKTRQGGLHFKPRPVFPRMYATGGERCPVNIFLTYQSKRPGELKTCGPMYLAIIDRPLRENVWYKSSRMGVNSIGKIVKEIIKDSPLADNDKKYTNHSVRKSTVKKMRASGISKEDIRTVTGHRHSDSLDAYDSGDDGVLYELSTTLSKEPNTVAVKSQAKSSSSSQGPSSSVQPLRTTYREIHGNVYNINVSNCEKVCLPTNTAQTVVSPKFNPKRLKCIIDSSPESSQ